MQRRAVVVELGSSRRRASRSPSRAASRAKRAVRSGAAGRSSAASRSAVKRRRQAAVELARELRAAARAPGSAASICTILVSSPKLPPKPRRKSIGTPITSATSAPLSAGAARAREEVRVVRGQAAAREAVQEDRDAERLGERAERQLAVAPVEVGARHHTGRSAARAARPPARSRRRPRPAARRGPAATPGVRVVGLHEDDVERQVEEGWAGRGAERGGERLVDAGRGSPRSTSRSARSS